MIVAPLCQGPSNYDYVAPTIAELHFNSNYKFCIWYLYIFCNLDNLSHVCKRKYLCRYLCLEGLGLCFHIINSLKTLKDFIIP